MPPCKSFVRIAGARSFSGVAGNEVAQSMVSKHISALEEHMSARLVSRTTRTLGLTSEGREFYERSQEILDDGAEAGDFCINLTPLGRRRSLLRL
jgi:DNA-binding transcriptional LysR family regulator